MLDDHKYSLNRVVAYSHPGPGEPERAYGPDGPERTYGYVTEVHLVDGENPGWEYSVTNSFTHEVCRLGEDQIHHGANRGYLDYRRRDGIAWVQGPPDAARVDMANTFWKRTLKEFIRTDIPKIQEREEFDERAMTEGRDLQIQAGDYIRVRGDLRDNIERHHNLYAKVLEVRQPDAEFFRIPAGIPGLSAGPHKTRSLYHVRLDTGDEAEVYDIEVKTVYTTQGRNVVLNWRAATFLAEAFGDDPPYEVQMEYLNGHVFTRDELQDMTPQDLGDLLARILYAKGMILWEEYSAKAESLCKSPEEYLVDQVLALSRFDMNRNRALTPEEIRQRRSDDERLRILLGG